MITPIRKYPRKALIHMHIPKISEIAQAWYRSFNPTKSQEAEATRRIGICEECEHNTFVPLARFHMCGLCKCPIAKKVFSPNVESCPAGKWSEVM